LLRVLREYFRSAITFQATGNAADGRGYDGEGSLCRRGSSLAGADLAETLPPVIWFAEGQYAACYYSFCWVQARQAGAVSRLTKVLATTGKTTLLSAAYTRASLLVWLVHIVHAFTLSVMHADDELLLDAAADVIAACCGLLACSGKV